ncbi:hypothetical protein NWF32_02250 [Pseudomonas qingdaonensis]|nr:hypothetical protein [Pseudomonas qingdaonensis]
MARVPGHPVVPRTARLLDAALTVMGCMPATRWPTVPTYPRRWRRC